MTDEYVSFRGLNLWFLYDFATLVEVNRCTCLVTTKLHF